MKACHYCKKLKKKTYNLGDSKVVCRECNTQRVRRYRESEKGKLAARKAAARYEATHPDRRRAWNKASKIPRKPCEVCGSKKTDKHHPDYSNPLQVIHLCRLHHVQAHR